MNESVYQRVLGPDIELLAPELRSYFTGRSVGRGKGVFEIAGSRLRILQPMLGYLAWQRILFPEYERDVPFDIVNSPTPDGGLHAVRTFHLPGRDRPLEDTMRVVDGQLHDFMGKRRGFEVRMSLTVTNGLLEMHSNRQWLHLARLRIPLPPLATATVAESWSNGRRHVDVRLRSPLIGEWFRYAGTFSYRYEEQ